MRLIRLPSAPRARSSAALSPPTSRLLAAAAVAALAAPVPAQIPVQFEELGKRYLPENFLLTQAAVWGDVDGDGDLDLVLGNYPYYPSGQNRLYLNNGSGGFRDATASYMPDDQDATHALALGDIDGDGDVDLVVGNLWSQNRIYRNDGADGFVDATAGRLPDDWAATRALALGDIDGDGDLDLVVGNAGWPYGEQNRLYLNDGSGRFADVSGSQLPPDVDATFALALEDVDGDGDRDLVTGNTGPNGEQNRLYANDGSGTFTDVTTSQMPVDTGLTEALALGDVDGDGDNDLVVGNHYGQNRLYRNDGSGTFTDVTATRMPVDNDSTTSLVLSDVDGDGDNDLVVGNFLYQNRLYRNDGIGTFTDVTAGHLPSIHDWTMALALGDVDGDGDRDLLVGNVGIKYGEANPLYLNDGAGVFTDPNASPLPADTDHAQAVVLGDVDGDGDRDLLIGNSGQNRLFRNDGRGGLLDVTATHLPGGYANTSSLALGDVDGDGDPDLVLGNYLQQNLLYRNDGNGSFTNITNAHLPIDSDTTRSVVLGDVDGDGDLDLVVGNHLLVQNRLYVNDGNGTFTDVTAAQLPTFSDDTWSLVLGDVDGDTDLDLVVGNVGRNRLYRNDGGTFTDVTATQMPLDNEWTLTLVLDDVDGDGDRDILAGNAPIGWFSNAQNRLYLNDGGGVFSDVTATHMTPIGDVTRALALADVDGDGDPDLVVANLYQDRLELNDGSGRFVDVTSSWMPATDDNSGSAAVGDIDRDGDPDLVVGNLGESNRLYSNLQRQLDAPQWLRLGVTYHLDVYARHGPTTSNDFALPYVSFVPAVPPVLLPPLGWVGLDPAFAIALPLVVLPQPGGVGTLALAIPNVPAFAGIPLYAQAVVVQDPVQIRFTNVTADVLQ